MPWCEECSRFWNPPSMGRDGECPSCGKVITAPTAQPRAPWHFKALLGAMAAYLGWRAYQGIAWLAHHL